MIAVVSIAAAAAVLLAPTPLAVPAGLLLALVLPGLALVRLLFAGRGLSHVEAAVLVPALSLAVLVVGGLLVHATGVELTRASWTAVTAGTVLLAVAAGARRTNGPSGEALAGSRGRLADLLRSPGRLANLAGPRGWLAGPRAGLAGLVRSRGGAVRRLLPLVAAAAVLTGAGALSLASAHADAARPVAALSVATVEEADAAGLRTVEVTATGLDPADGPYQVRVTAADHHDELTVPGGRTWSQRVRMPAAERVTVELYRAGDDTPHRTVFLGAAAVAGA